ncbi:AAA family ATPase [Paenibacillus sp. BSR1-1]|uniref:AAA family ATPase n=1 Tax=Paenibacillus sp. BSR1-1 TaxID=3020845 RepID=UPI0025B2594E|nr:AAA family ATPase [Paenibacillus sp. BSR1-1]MDN3019724.1 AAA family ATPase [Paenibacillus sp. BSR1-1]
MDINWYYFSDTNTPPGEIKILLEKQRFKLTATNQIEKLHTLLIQNNQSVLFLKAHTLYNVYELCQEISVLYPHVYIILIVPDNMENLKKAMLMGASDTLRSSYDHDELSEAIDHAKKYMEHRAKKDQLYLLKEKSRVIAISNPKGGVGRTLLTVNLAISFARMGKKVAVIDGNLQFGEVAMYYNMKPKRTIYEWVKEGYGRENYSIDQYMTKVDGDVSILAAPPRPEFFEGISDEHIKVSVEAAKKLFDIVLIDMPVFLSEIHLRCLDMADEILLLAINEISVLRLSQLYLETLESIKQRDKVKLVLNRTAKGQGIEIKKIEEILEMPLFHSLPDQANVANSSIKAGQPFMLSNSRSQLGKGVWKLAEMLFDQMNKGPAESKKAKRWFPVGK